MNETTPEPTSPRDQSSNIFMRKMGPLPLWAWMAIILGLALAYYYYKQHKASTAATQNAAAGQSTSPSGTDSSLIPQFVNQVYTNNVPPQSPPVSSSGSTGTTATPPPVGGGIFGTGTGANFLGTSINSQANQYPAPSGLTVSKLSNTSGLVKWNYITGVTPKPQSYTVAVYQLNGKLAQMFTVQAPDTATGQAQATVSGLHSGYSYNVNVWANGGKIAPAHSTAKLTV